MKVGELKVGTLVMASGNWEIISSSWPTYERTDEHKVFKKVYLKYLLLKVRNKISFMAY